MLARFVSDPFFCLPVSISYLDIGIDYCYFNHVGRQFIAMYVLIPIISFVVLLFSA
jgi:hypothetical protein